MKIIGLDLGGTTFAVASVDENGAITHAREEDTRQHDGPDILLPRLAQAARAVIESAHNDAASTCGALGIGVPGAIKHREGVCIYAPNLDGWRDLPVAAPLCKALNLPVFVINDAKAATLGRSAFWCRTRRRIRF